MFRERMYIPNQLSIKYFILDEFHRSPYTAHPGYQKLFSAIKTSYYWPHMRKGIVKYLEKCLQCQQVKAKSQNPPPIFLHLLPIPKWKWETITLDFITKLPKSKRENDSIMVVVDKLSKLAHFSLFKSTY